MLRLLPVLLLLAFQVYCLVNCIQTPDEQVRNLPKPLWLLLIVLLGGIGGVAWLIAGRPRASSAGRGGSGPLLGRAGAPGSPPRGNRPLAPDDDPEFLRSLRRAAEEQRRRQREAERAKKPPEDEGRDDATGPGTTPAA